MEIKAGSRFVRMSPRKLRLVADMVRTKSLDQVLVALENSPKRAATPLLKVVKQALSNATHNLTLDRSSLKIKKIAIDEGPTYKRWQPVSRGRAFEIKKRTSHIIIVLEGEKVAKVKTRDVKKEETNKNGKKD